MTFTWTPILAFAAVALAFTIGDYISSKTKGLIASILTVDILFLIFGGVLHILPADLTQINFLTQVTSSVGMALVLTDLGTSFKPSEFAREWKTVLVALAGTTGCVVVCVTIGSMLFGREMAFACAAPLAGGIVAGNILTETVTQFGRTDLAVYISGVVGFQVLLGAPICSFCLRKEAMRFVAAEEHNLGITSVTDSGTSQRETLIQLPAVFKSPNGQLARLGLLAGVSMVLAGITGINSAIFCLLFGVLGALTGLLDKDGLAKAGSKGFLGLAMFAMICESFLKISMEQFLGILIPMFVYMVLGVLGALLLSMVVGHFLGWSCWMSMAVSMCIILGYPSNYAITTGIIDSVVKDQGFSDEQIACISNHLLSKILLGSIVAISIASVVLASYLAPMVFA